MLGEGTCGENFDDSPFWQVEYGFGVFDEGESFHEGDVSEGGDEGEVVLCVELREGNEDEGYGGEDEEDA